MRTFALVFALMTISAYSVASVVGLSNYPLTMQNKAMNTEFNNITSNGAGMGINARYHQRINDAMNFDVGAGVTDGDRSNRFFAGLDTQLIPDYGRQPRVSIKGLFETLSFDEERITNLGVAPILSKGFAVNGNEIFPYVTTPIRMVLIGDTRRTESIAAALGVNGRLPLAGYDNLIANAEINVDIRNSYSGFVLGVSLPIN